MKEPLTPWILQEIRRISGELALWESPLPETWHVTASDLVDLIDHLQGELDEMHGRLRATQTGTYIAAQAAAVERMLERSVAISKGAVESNRSITELLQAECARTAQLQAALEEHQRLTRPIAATQEALAASPGEALGAVREAQIYLAQHIATDERHASCSDVTCEEAQLLATLSGIFGKPSEEAR